MQNGLYIDEISLPNIKAKQLYIKWNEKVDVSIKEISLLKQKSDSEDKIDYQEIGNYLKSLSFLDSWFESVVIDKIVVDNITASFKYKDQERGYLVASSTDFHLKSSLYFDSGIFNVSIDELVDFKRKIDLNGSLFFNMDRIEAFADLNVNINDDLDAQIFIATNVNRLNYKLKSNQEIKNLTHLINIANLPKEAKYWALDAIEMSQATINSAVGFIDFDNIGDAYKNVKIRVTVDKMNYTYNQELDSIHTEKTILEFKEGVLFIYPKEAYSYGMYLDKSWLKIDFTQASEILTLHLLFDGMLNKDFLKILNTYKVKLPFLQKEGLVTTNLKLVIDLIGLDTDVKGDFFSKKANFDYLGLNIDIFDAYIKLDNNDVRVDNMRVKYQDIAIADVDVVFNAKESIGKVTFNPKQIDFQGVTLEQENNPTSIIYTIEPGNDRIDVTKSKWKYDDIVLNVDKINIPFDLKELLIKLPATYIDAEDIATAFVSGNISIDTMKMNLRADVLNLDYAGVELSQSNTPLNISYDEKLHVSSDTNILLNINDFEFDLHNFSMSVAEHGIDLHNTNLLSTDGLLAMKINASYNTKSHKGVVELKNLKIESKHKVLYSKDKALLSLEMIEDNFYLNSKELQLDFNTTDSGWKAKCNSFASLYEDSEALQNFRLKDGKAEFYKQNNEESIRFNASIKYPYKLLIENGIPVEEYKVKGKFNSKKSFININNKINIKISDKIKINMRDTIVNIPDLMDSMNDINISSNQDSSRSTIINALNSTLDLGNDRRVVSDAIKLQHHNEITTAQLEHEKGFAGFKLQNDRVHLYGENFGDKFMESLFSLSRFKGGKLSFSMNGTLDNYDGLFYITNTTIVDYKMLNNILAFVNTVPSLATFSLPGYSKSGLKVSSAYMNFNAQNSLFNISDFFLDSKEIDILGSGIADVANNKIDVTLNLKTDLGSSASKIPLVGYVILGDDAISTTMSITGKLNNPKVESLIAKEILVAPINIVKRALLLPYDLLKNKKDSNGSK